MNELRNIFKNLLPAVLMVWCMTGFAQIDRLNRASLLLNEKKLDAARVAIDSVIQHPDTKKDPVSWTTRAYIYYELYKRSEKNRYVSPFRDTSVASLRTSYALKPGAEFIANNNRLMQVYSSHYYSIARTQLQDSLNDVKSQFAYNKSKELAKIVKPDTNFANADVEYYNTVGGYFSDAFNSDNSNTKAGEIAKISLLKVIELQPGNTRAHYNLGIMYYNQAVNLGKSLDYGADISQIDVIQESIIKLAKQAQQQIDIVYKNDPNNKKAIEALYFINRMLNDQAKTEKFKKECIDKGIKLD